MPDLGLTSAQLANAETIISVGRRRGMSERDIQTALTVAVTESDLLNHANSNVPESMQIPHDKVGSDHMSVGVFQQQVGIWGNAPDLMNLEKSANLFYDALAKIPNRDAMSIPQAAQTVQRSAFGDGSNYAEDLPLATQIMNALKGIDVSTSTLPADLGKANDPLGWIQNPANLKRIGMFALGATIIVIALSRLFSKEPIVKAAVGIATKGLVK